MNFGTYPHKPEAAAVAYIRTVLRPTQVTNQRGPRRTDPVTSTSQLPVTVLVQTKNEAVGIAQCLSHLSQFDEVIVVDSLSTDGTPDIARDFGAQVIDFHWNGQYPKKKQWQLEHVETKNDWVLFLDADEFPTAELISELKQQFESDAHTLVAAYDVPLFYHFGGVPLRHGHRVYKRCLVHRERVTFPPVDDLDIEGMGELEGHYQPVSDGPIARLTARLGHDDKDPIGTWFDRHNRYSDWEAALRQRQRTRTQVANLRSRQGRWFDRVPGKPILFFIYSYLVKRGFLDGRAGFDYAVALSTYYWQINLKTRLLKNEGPA